MLTLRELLEEMFRLKASDLHLTVGAPPMFRVDGSLVRSQYPALTAEDTKRLSYSIMSEKQKLRFEETKELDLSFGLENMSRFRCNIFLQRGCVAAAIRQIPFRISSFEELGIPKQVSDLASLPQGLVLITGPTGSGKSTTLAAFLDRINQERKLHVLTVEDPIEYLHKHNNCLINQREVKADTDSFAQALKYALRQDPDVVMIGEMRDLETMESALTISETGHLTFATLHTGSAIESVKRVIDVFPKEKQEQVRIQLSFVLQAAVSQQLIPKVGGGRVLALEVMICTPAIKAMIRDGKVHQIYSLIQAGQKFGMKTMNQSLMELYLFRRISLDDALSRSTNAEELKEMLARRQVG